jgi:hypothetical protein
MGCYAWCAAAGSDGALRHRAWNPYTALDAFLTEHRLCRPGLDEPDVSPMLVCLWCSCRARIAVKLSPMSARG